MKTEEEIKLLMESAKREFKRSKLAEARAVYDTCGWILGITSEPLFDSLIVKQKEVFRLENLIKEYNERLSN